MMLTTALVATAGLLLAALYMRRRKQHLLFKNLGIPGPEPHWWLGNFGQLNKKPNNEHLQIQEWAKIYGKVFGYYEGPTPVLVVSDADILKQIFIKNFSHFHARKQFPVQPDPDYGKNIHMFTARGNRWKRLRSITNPTFSSAKLKQALPLVNSKVGTMIKKCQEAADGGQVINIQSLFEALTMDVIGESAFGMQVDSLSDPNEKFMVACRKIFYNVGRKPWLIMLAAKLPEIRRVMWEIIQFLFKVTKSPEQFVINSMGEVIEMRRKDPELRRADLMQLMMDAEADETFLKDPAKWAMTADDNDKPRDSQLTTESNGTANHKTELKSPETTKLGKKKLTNEEIKMQGFLFLLAGYETTSTALSYCAYLLALHPDKQDRLFDELDQNLTAEEEPSYEKILSLPYLDMVLCESLRLYPIAGLVVNRTCMETCKLDHLTIPAGVSVQANSWAVHRDPDLWGHIDPEIFEPERFLPEHKATRHSLAWIPFGAGPRNCVGMRFAMMEAKVALGRMIKNFRIERCSETEVPLQLAERGVVTPLNGVRIKLISRSH